MTHDQLCQELGIKLAYCGFGAFDTTDIMGSENERAIFSLYRERAYRYKKVLDIGANVGIHSLVMENLGWEVTAFEPDPVHYGFLCRNLNHALPVNAAVSDRDGTARFVRVLDNTTGNHIEGFKTPYGLTETIEVRTLDAGPLFQRADFAKIDAEGHEAVILSRLTPNCDCVVEVGNEKTAGLIYERFAGRMRTQRNGWSPVKSFADMPKHHSEGALFIGNW